MFALADYVTRYTSKASDELEKRIKRVYKQAAEEVQKKLDDFIRGHKARNAQMLQMVSDGKMSKQDYQKWMRGQVFQGDQWKQKLKDITEVYVHADEKAREIVGGTSKNVFMEAANYTAYDLEKGMRGAVAFNVYDAKTVERLLKDDPKMLPEWKIDQPKDYKWNEKRVRNAVAQGIIQGESVEEVGERLTGELATSNAAKMDMFARTAINGAQNAGRMDRLHEAEEMGIEVRKKWLATLDQRTRDTHQALDGQEQPIDEPFVVDGMKIDYPGDPFAPPELVYNCRCTLTYVYPKYQHLQHNHERRDQLNDKNIENMTYYQWLGLEGRKTKGQEKTFDPSSVKIPHSKLHPDISYASNYFAGVVDEDNDYRERIKGKEYELKDVLISDLYTDQNTNKVENIRKMLGANVKEPVVVVHVDGKDILLDGNTRSAAASLKGEKTIKAKYYDLDSQKQSQPKYNFENDKSFAADLGRHELYPYPYDYADYDKFLEQARAFDGERNDYIEDVRPGTSVSFRNGSRAYGGEKYCDGQHIDYTIARLQEKVPITDNSTHLVVCDYEDAWLHLPNGRSDRRFKGDSPPLAQVFHDSNQIVIAFDRSYMNGNLEDSLAKRHELILKGEVLSNVFPIESPETVVMHEWGHVINDYYTHALVYQDETAKNMFAWWQTLTKDEIRSGVSDYASENFGEFCAECFAEMQTDNPRPLAKKYWDFMSELIKKRYTYDK